MDVKERPWDRDWDETVVRQLAAGLLDYSDRCRAGTPIRLPYPANLQRALDRLTLMCLVSGVAPPTGVVDLLTWARRAPADWPFVPNSMQLDVEEPLLVFDSPSVACQELGLLRGDVEGEMRENALMTAVLDLCRAGGRQDSYVAFRELLIRQPAMSGFELAEQLSRPELAFLSGQLRAAYREAPPEALVGAVAQVCVGCGNLRTPAEDRPHRVCVDPVCPDPQGSYTELPAGEGVVWIGRELRTFVARPGRAELRLADRLRKIGIAVQLWPQFDTCDLRVFENDIWAVDVKAWANPARLGAHLSRHPFHPPSGTARAFIVVADEQCRGRPGYIRQLVRNTTNLGPSSGVEAVTERKFVSLVGKRLKEHP